MSKIINVGRVTSYADAVAGGYTGTREQWEHDLANLGTVAAEVEADRAEVAENTATVAEDKAAVEEDKSAAESAAGSAAESAASAHTDAIAATAAKEAAQTAQGLAENAASTAANAKDAAQTAQGAAEDAQTAAEAAQTASEDAQTAAAGSASAAAESATAAAESEATAQHIADMYPTDKTLSLVDKAADGKATGDAVADLKSAIDEIDEISSINLWGNGDISVGDNGFRHLLLVNPLPAGTYTFSAIATKSNDTSNVQVSISKSQDTSISPEEILVTGDFAPNVRGGFTFTIDETAYSVRLRSKTSSSTIPSVWTFIQIEQGSYITPYSPYRTAYDQVARDTADASETVILSNAQNKKTDIPFTVAKQNCGINPKTGAEVSYDGGISCTDFVDVSNWKNIEFPRIVTTAQTSAWATTGAAFYDENRQALTNKGVKNYSNGSALNYVPCVITVPEGAKYARFTTQTANTYGVFYIKGIPSFDNYTQRIIDIPFRTGKINDTTGAMASDTTRARNLTGYYKLGSYLKILVPNGYKISIYTYKRNDNASFGGGSGFFSEDVLIPINPTDYYRFVIGKTDDSTIDPADGALFTFIDYGEKEISIESTGDNTDRTIEINSLLRAYRHLKLGTGEYWTTGITMVDNSEIYGDGYGSIIYLDESVATDPVNAITVGNSCTIHDLQIKGRQVEYDYNNPEGTNPLPTTPEGRNGIYLDADFSKTTVYNCYIHGFSGGAIKGYNTGTGVNKTYLVSDCILEYNCVGVWLDKSSEYNVIGNCRINYNYYAVINNGGNNTIHGSNITSNYYGFYFDNHDGDYSNNMHGTLSDCILHHIIIEAIHIYNTGSGITITGCRFQGGGISIEKSYYIAITGCSIRSCPVTITDSSQILFANGFIRNSPITITNGGLTTYDNCSIREESTVTITNNASVYFNNCYNGNDLFDPTGKSIPIAPTTSDGTYKLVCTVASGVRSYSWISDT